MGRSGRYTLVRVSARARILDLRRRRSTATWVATSALGGAGSATRRAWTPEHLVLAALSRCILTSYRHHARRAGLEPVSSAAAHGVVTRREEDGRFAFVEIRVDLDVDARSAAGRATTFWR